MVRSVRRTCVLMHYAVITVCVRGWVALNEGCDEVARLENISLRFLAPPRTRDTNTPKEWLRRIVNVYDDSSRRAVLIKHIDLESGFGLFLTKFLDGDCVLHLWQVVLNGLGRFVGWSFRRMGVFV